MADEPENLVLALLRDIRRDVAALDTKIDRVDAKVDRVIADVAVVKAEQAAQSRVLNWLRHEIVPGEIAATNRDIADLKRRVDALEGRRS